MRDQVSAVANDTQPLPKMTPRKRQRLLTAQLKSVSRAFYLTLRILPRDLREPVGLAYLLARAADTMSDTRLLAPEERLRYLHVFRSQVQGPASAKTLSEIARAAAGGQAVQAERLLLESLPQAFALLEALPEPDRRLVRTVVVSLTQGMELDLTAFPAEGSGRLGALKDSAELARYTYLVAGCVGEFWTEITCAHTKALASWDVRRMSVLGVRFGKALQLTNVLRDAARDLRLGRCYLPRSDLEVAGLAPEDLLDPATAARARSVLAAHLDVALGHYEAAHEYLLAIPRRCWRLRLAALWPILIGLATLAKLARNEGWLDPARPSKVSRAWVYRMMALSLFATSFDMLLKVWIGRLRRQVEKAI